MSFEYDVERRLKKAYQTNAPSNFSTYGYDAQNRLASRTVTSGTGTATVLYIHDINDHIIAETDTAGVTKREYIWLDDLPVAVVDGVDTASPTVYYVHTDHLARPARMVAQNGVWVWDVIHAPFGGTAALFDATAKLDMRFPGQWFQMENGLAYNWHRHYDATLGRYVQPDPLRVDEKEGATVGGVTPSVSQARSTLVDDIYLRSAARRFGVAEGMAAAAYSPRHSTYPDGSSAYGYSTQNPLAKIDPKGLWTSPKLPSFSPMTNKCDVDCDELFDTDLTSCLNLFGGNMDAKGYKYCEGNAWGRRKHCLSGKPLIPLICDLVTGCL